MLAATLSASAIPAKPVKFIRQPACERAKYRTVDDLPNSDFVMDNVCWLAVYPRLDARHALRRDRNG